jgi:dihydrolipoamide dehydrogenase
MKQKDEAVTGLTKGIETLFKKNKVDYAKGTGSFCSKNEIDVKLNDGKQDKIRAKNIIIATGSDVSPLPGEPLKIDEKIVVSSTGALSLKEVPKKMIVIGAGVIGLELGSVYQGLGAEVIVVEYMDKVIPFADGEVSTFMQKYFTKEGFKFLMGHKVVGGSVGENSAKVIVENNKTGEKKEYQADIVLVSTGRRPYTAALKASDFGVKMDKQGRIEINDHLQTSLPGVWAIGDVVRGAMLAHKAEEEGIACVENILGEHGHVNYNAIPGVIYTHPEIAFVGKTEEELKKENVAFNKGFFPMMGNSRARAMHDAEGFVKVLADKKTDKILGVHMISSVAGEAIAEAVLAMEYGASSEDVGRTCHAHPTMSEAVKEACLGAHFKPIHF